MLPQHSPYAHLQDVIFGQINKSVEVPPASWFSFIWTSFSALGLSFCYRVYSFCSDCSQLSTWPSTTSPQLTSLTSITFHLKHSLLPQGFYACSPLCCHALPLCVHVAHSLLPSHATSQEGFPDSCPSPLPPSRSLPLILFLPPGPFLSPDILQFNLFILSSASSYRMYYLLGFAIQILGKAWH